MSKVKKFAAQRLPRPILRWIKGIYYSREATRFWEPDVEPIKSLVKPGDVVIDLGANYGEYTFLLSSLVGQKGRVYAVEPIQQTYEILSSVVRKHHLSNVELFNCAISEKDGLARMEIPLHSYGTPNFYMAHVVSGLSSAANSFEVSCRSLDSLLLNGLAKSVSFIKCDVEGHELAFLKGASELFRRERPAMMIEVSGKVEVQDSPSNEFFLIMKEYGYAAYWMDGKCLRKRLAGQWSVNYFFLQPSHLKHVSKMIVE